MVDSTGDPSSLSSPSRHPFTVYPNPADDEIIIQFGENFTSASQLELRDVQGKLHHQAVIKEGQTKLTMSVEPLPKGVYILSLKNDSTFSNKEIFIY
jgi:hypothetical protein